nr:histone acetyltransferase HAC1-like [Tanacetum cinerariifolium]
MVRFVPKNSTYEMSLMVVSMMTLSGFGKDKILRTLAGRPIAVAAMAVYLRYIDVAAETVIVYAWTHDLWFRVAYAFVLFSFDATVAAIHGERHAGGLYPCLGQASRTTFKQMQPVSAAMAVFDPLCMCIHLRYIDVAAETVIVYAWTHDLWFRVAYAFVLFSFDATVAAIHGERHAGGVSENYATHNQAVIGLYYLSFVERIDQSQEYYNEVSLPKLDGGIDHPYNLTRHPTISEHDAQNKGAHHERVVHLRKMINLLVHASQCRSPHFRYLNFKKPLKEQICIVTAVTTHKTET